MEMEVKSAPPPARHPVVVSIFAVSEEPAFSCLLSSILLTALLCVVSVSHTIFAQGKRSADSTLQVTVVDPAGAAVSNARVTISKPQQNAVTNTRGEASFNQLS